MVENSPAPCAGLRSKARQPCMPRGSLSWRRCVRVAQLLRRRIRHEVGDIPARVRGRPSRVRSGDDGGSGRRRKRGFDHAQLLAKAVAERLQLPCRPLLARGPGPPQTGRPLEDRRRGPSFTTRTKPPGAVLLVDDVVTSGATLAAAARALRVGGTKRVDTVLAASTPLKARAGGSEHLA